MLAIGPGVECTDPRILRRLPPLLMRSQLGGLRAPATSRVRLCGQDARGGFRPKKKRRQRTVESVYCGEQDMIVLNRRFMVYYENTLALVDDDGCFAHASSSAAVMWACTSAARVSSLPSPNVRARR